MKGHTAIFSSLAKKKNLFFFTLFPETGVDSTLAFHLVNNCGLFVFCNELRRRLQMARRAAAVQVQEELEDVPGGGWAGHWHS